MAKTVCQLTQTELTKFDPTRNLSVVIDMKRWELASSRLPTLTTVLHSQFGAQRIVIFGSFTEKHTFTHWSDIDLAVWGVAPERFYKAVTTLNDLSPDIKVDLVDPERCESDALRQIIDKEGVEIDITTC